MPDYIEQTLIFPIVASYENVCVYEKLLYGCICVFVHVCVIKINYTLCVFAIWYWCMIVFVCVQDSLLKSFMRRLV